MLDPHEVLIIQSLFSPAAPGGVTLDTETIARKAWERISAHHRINAAIHEAIENVRQRPEWASHRVIRDYVDELYPASKQILQLRFLMRMSESPDGKWLDSGAQQLVQECQVAPQRTLKATENTKQAIRVPAAFLGVVMYPQERSREIVHVSNRECVELTKTEHAIVYCLWCTRTYVKTDRLTELVFGSLDYVGSLHTHKKNASRKIRPLGLEIINKRPDGYLLTQINDAE